MERETKGASPAGTVTVVDKSLVAERKTLDAVPVRVIELGAILGDAAGIGTGGTCPSAVKYKR